MLDTHHDIRPVHVNVEAGDLDGNGVSGRYIVLTGSPSRAKKISEQFDNLIVREHPRGHTLYLGTLQNEQDSIDVAVIPTGMGCPSTDIIINELYAAGGRRFLRVGTAGSLQPQAIKAGSMVIASAAVRDEGTSKNYITVDFPATAHLDVVTSAQAAADDIGISNKTYTGTIHTKDSLYARELECSHLEENKLYMEAIRNAGVLASEMESSHIFVMAQILNYRATQGYTLPDQAIKAGAILAVIGDDEPFVNNAALVQEANEQAIALALATIKRWYQKEHQ